MITKLIMNIFGQQIIDKRLLQESLKEIDYNQDVAFELRVSKKIKQFTFLIGLLLTISGVILLISRLNALNEDNLTGIGILLGGGVFILMIAIDYALKYVKLSNQYLESNGLFTKKTEVKWEEVKEVKFIDQKQVVFYTKQGKVTVYKGFVGSNVTLRMIFDKLDIKVYINSLLQNQFYATQFLNNLTDEEEEAFRNQVKILTKGK